MGRTKVAVCLSIICILGLLVSAGFGEELSLGPVDRVADFPEGWQMNTPEENIFRLSSGEAFILLEKGDGGSYVLAMDSYGVMPYDSDGTQKFDPSDPNNVAYWLNHDLIETQEGGLPAAMRPYLMERDYLTEAGSPNGNCPEDYMVRAKVVLLSQTEWLKYINRFGAGDEIPQYGWWLRTGLGSGSDASMVLWSTIYEGATGTTAGHNAAEQDTGQVRPAFWLSDDFFLQVPLSFAGQTVRDEVFSQLDAEKTTLYTDIEKRDLGMNNVPLRSYLPFDTMTGVTVEETAARINGAAELELPGIYAEKLVLELARSSGGQIAVTGRDSAVTKLEIPAGKGTRVEMNLTEAGPITHLNITGDALDISSGYFLLPDGFENNSSFQQGSWAVTEGAVSITEKGLSLGGGGKFAGSASLRRNLAYNIRVRFNSVEMAANQTFRIKILLTDIYGRSTTKWQTLTAEKGNREGADFTYALSNRAAETAFVTILAENDNGPGTVTVTAVELLPVSEDISFDQDWAPYNLIENGKDHISVSVRTDSQVQRSYTVQYILKYLTEELVLEGEKQTVQAENGKPGTVQLPLENLHYGSADLEVVVWDGGRRAGTFTCEICIYKPFTEHYFDEFTNGRIGMSDKHFSATNGEIMEVFKKIGGRVTRGAGADWGWTEFAKGLLDFSNVQSLHEQRGVPVAPVIVAYNNPVYDQDGNEKGALDTPSEVQGMADYITTFARTLTDIQDYEIWNEPNAPGYWSGASPYEYASAVKILSSFLHQDNPDVKIYGGSIDVSRDGLGYSRTIFEMGIYPYIESYSVHPYYHPSLNDDAFPDKTRSYVEILEDFGGWKDVDLTEIGWRTDYEETLNATQASELVKIYVRSRELGVTPSLYTLAEANQPVDSIFGILRMDLSARPAVAALSNYFGQISGGEYLFRDKSDEEICVFCYWRNGAPVLIAWDPSGEKTLSFDTDVSVQDLYGNSLGSMCEVKLQQQPVYITGVERSWAEEKGKAEILRMYAAFIEKYKTGLPEDFLTAAEELQSKIQAGLPDNDVVERHYELGLELMQAKGQTLFLPENTMMLYSYHQIGSLMAVMASLDAEGQTGTAAEAYQTLRAAYDSKREYNTDVQVFTQELLRHAKRETDEIQNLTGPYRSTADRNMLINSRELTANGLLRWAAYTMGQEETQRLGTTFMVTPAENKGYAGSPTKAEISVFNSTYDNISGVLEVCNTQGKVVARQENVMVAARAHTTVPVEFYLEEETLNTMMYYTVRYISDGYVSESSYPVTKLPQITVERPAVTTSIADLTALQYTLHNITDADMDVIVQAEVTEGWELGTATEQLAAGEVKTITVPVLKTRETAFHHYPVKLRVTDGQGTVVYEETELMNFAVSSETQTPIQPDAFDGDISDWSDAYPYYISVPEEFSSMEQWQDSELSARVFSKWDAENLYFLVDVYDETHSNMQTGSMIWDGDAVQIALDVLDTDSPEGYDGDDYEIAAALTTAGKELWCHFDGDRNNVGQRSAQLCGIVRDEGSKNTRYLICIPKGEITPFEMKQGAYFGMDIAVADSDLIATRESAISICGTITSGKYPERFINWHLISGTEQPTEGQTEIEEIFKSRFGQ